MWLGIPLFKRRGQQDAFTVTAHSMAWFTPDAAHAQAPWPAGQRWEWSGSLASGLDLAVLQALLPLEHLEPAPLGEARCRQPDAARPQATKSLIPSHAPTAP